MRWSGRREGSGGREEGEWNGGREGGEEPSICSDDETFTSRRSSYWLCIGSCWGEQMCLMNSDDAIASATTPGDALAVISVI